MEPLLGWDEEDEELQVERKLVKKCFTFDDLLEECLPFAEPWIFRVIRSTYLGQFYEQRIYLLKRLVINLLLLTNNIVGIMPLLYSFPERSSKLIYAIEKWNYIFIFGAAILLFSFKIVMGFLTFIKPQLVLSECFQKFGYLTLRTLLVTLVIFTVAFVFKNT